MIIAALELLVLYVYVDKCVFPAVSESFQYILKALLF